MVLATVDPAGHPSARVVLCKDIVVDPGYVSFYSNYLSRKGRELAGNPRAALVLHWDHLHRQVRIEGEVVRAPEADSDEYFRTRPWQRRIGAWASAQSEPVASRSELEQAVVDVARRFGTPVPGPEYMAEPPGGDPRIPRPPHWGGYRLQADAVELWVEGESRIHDRARWTRPLRGAAGGVPAPAGQWSVSRLQP
jgi:pyridoxamine 5'-phosphate oxidase